MGKWIDRSGHPYIHKEQNTMLGGGKAKLVSPLKLVRGYTDWPVPTQTGRCWPQMLAMKGNSGSAECTARLLLLVTRNGACSEQNTTQAWPGRDHCCPWKSQGVDRARGGDTHCHLFAQFAPVTDQL